MEAWGELIKIGGLGVLFFVGWFTAQKHQNANFEKMLENEREMWRQILDEQSKREERGHTLLKDMVDRSDFHTSQLSRLEQKIDTKWSCPIVKGSAA